jgi:predicted secreted protein
MSWGWAFFIFLNSWWVTLFAILPWGITHTRTVGGDDYASAPDKPDMKKKFFITTIVAACITAAISALIASGLIPLKNAIM